MVVLNDRAAQHAGSTLGHVIVLHSDEVHDGHGGTLSTPQKGPVTILASSRTRMPSSGSRRVIGSGI